MPYLDHNATSPLVPVARDAWLRIADEAWQNPSSPYRDAARAKIRLDAARAQLAEFLNTPPERIVFNSSATEGINAVFAHWSRTLPPSAHIAVNPTEHPSVLETARRFFPDRITLLELTGDGVVRLDALEKLLSSAAPKFVPIAAVAVMAANNETGVLQPWREIAALCARHDAAYLCDATQWLGKLPAAGLGSAGWIIGSAHKFGGPKGCGFLALPAHAESFSSLAGGAQENAHRAGTENLPGIAALVAALADAEQTKTFLETERLRWRQDFEYAALAAVPGARIVAAKAERLWNTVSLLLPHGENIRWVTKLDKHSVQVSTGSACGTGHKGPSHVLAALGLSPDEARRTIRLSSSWSTTPDDWRAAAEALTAVAPDLVPAANVIKL